jgi:RNA polymerase sigma-70 factor (ECF subfamily)
MRVSISELRRRGRCRWTLTSTGELPERYEGIAHAGPDREALWRFEAILGSLSPSSRRVFVLRYVEKLELLDVAAAMGISVPTVKRHLARAIGHVAAMVEREPALTDYVQRTSPDMTAEFAFTGGLRSHARMTRETEINFAEGRSAPESQRRRA